MPSKIQIKAKEESVSFTLFQFVSVIYNMSKYFTAQNTPANPKKGA